MKTILINDNGDRVTKNGMFVYLNDIDAVIQTCEQAVKQQLKELQYDQTKGIEYFDNVFMGEPNFQRFESEARNQILNVDGVTGIDSFIYDLDKDNLNYTATIKTIYGTGNANGSI